MKEINDRRNGLFLTSNKSFFIKEMDIWAGSDKSDTALCEVVSEKFLSREKKIKDPEIGKAKGQWGQREVQDQEQQAGARRGGQGTEAVLRTGHRTDFFFF